MPTEYDPELFDRICSARPNHAQDHQARVIRCARELSGMDREQLAKLAGVSRREIMWLENGWLYPNEQEVIDKVNGALVVLYRHLQTKADNQPARNVPSDNSPLLKRLANFAKALLVKIR